MESDSVDFVNQVAERLGVSHDDALVVLGAWLTRYEPLERAQTLAQRRGRAVPRARAGSGP